MSRNEDSEGSKVSRRAVFAGAGALAATGAVPLGASKAFAAGAWDLVADVVVVGSGAAGGSAGARAIALGKSVIVLEKAAIVGGTTGKSGGGSWILNNSLMRKQGLRDPRKDAIRLMARMSYPQDYNPDDPRYGLSELDYDLLATYYDNGARIVDELEKSGALYNVQYTDSDGNPNFPDYSSQLPENKAPLGRMLRPVNLEGKGGPPHGRGGAGPHMVEQLTGYIEKHGGKILTRHRVTALVLNDKREVVGVQAVDGAGKTVAVRARQGVVFGSGGFAHNLEYVRQFLKGPIFGGCAVPTNEGDFIAIAGAVGAGLGNLDNAWWAEVPVERALKTRSTAMDLFVPPGDSMFYVNKYGQRVVDEHTMYNERTQIHFVWDPHRYEYPNYILFMIWDQRTHERFPGVEPLPPKGTTAPDIMSADTLGALADMIDVRLKSLGSKVSHVRLDPGFKANLLKTKERFNTFARNRVDEDFHRGELPASAWWAHDGYGGAKWDPKAPNDMLYPLADTGPYYAILVGPGVLDTKGGPRINAKAQVLDTLGKPIPGLYGAGNCVASPSGVAYWAGGGTIGLALTFGALAGENAAMEPVKVALL